MTWPALLSLAAGTYLIRLLGLLLPGRVRVPAHVERYFDLGATALLLALVAVSTFTQDGGFAGWARPLGVLVGAVAAWRRVPFVLVVLIAPLSAWVLLPVVTVPLAARLVATVRSHTDGPALNGALAGTAPHRHRDRA